jgi:hypothetical protein
MLRHFHRSTALADSLFVHCRQNLESGGETVNALSDEEEELNLLQGTEELFCGIVCENPPQGLERWSKIAKDVNSALRKRRVDMQPLKDAIARVGGVEDYPGCWQKEIAEQEEKRKMKALEEEKLRLEKEEEKTSAGNENPSASKNPLSPSRRLRPWSREKKKKSEPIKEELSNGEHESPHDEEKKDVGSDDIEDKLAAEEKKAGVCMNCNLSHNIFTYRIYLFREGNDVVFYVLGALFPHGSTFLLLLQNTKSSCT